MKAIKHLKLGFVVLGIVFGLCSTSQAELRPPDVALLAKNAELIGVIRVDRIVPERDRSIEYSIISATLQETIKGKSRSEHIQLKTDGHMETDDRKSYVKGHRYLVFLRHAKSNYSAAFGHLGVFEMKNGSVGNWPTKLAYPKTGNAGPEALGPFRAVKYEQAKKDVLRLVAPPQHKPARHHGHMPNSTRAHPATGHASHRTRWRLGPNTALSSSRPAPPPISISQQ